MTVLDLSYNFANLSVHDLLEARDTYHYHLLSKANVVGTAIGLYLIRKDEAWPTRKGEGKTPPNKKTYARTLSNSEVRDYSWPCILAFVRSWANEDAFGPAGRYDPAQIVPKTLYLADGRAVPVCVVQADQAGSDTSATYSPPGILPAHKLGGGSPIIVRVQGAEYSATAGCLVSDGHLTYALTARHACGEADTRIFSYLRSGEVEIGASSANQLTRKPFSEVYPDFPGRRSYVALDVGLVRLDQVDDWTSNTYGLPPVGPLGDVHEKNLSLRLIDQPVLGRGATSGLVRGTIKALFYRYRSVGGYDYVGDFLISPAEGLATRHGDSGMVWHLDATTEDDAANPKPLPKRDLRPLAVAWGGQVFEESGVRSAFSIATSLSNVCKLLDVELVTDQSRGVSGYWGRTGHYSIAAFAVALVGDTDLRDFLNRNLGILSFDLDTIAEKGFDKSVGQLGDNFVPLADVPDEIWKKLDHGKNGREGGRDVSAGPHGSDGPEHPNHYADIDGEIGPHKTFRAACLADDSNLTVDAWLQYYETMAAKAKADGDEDGARRHRNKLKQGLLPFRVWQFFDAMVAFVENKDVVGFLTAAGAAAHYMGDASQPLHGSVYSDGDASRTVTRHHPRTGEDEEVSYGSGVHSAFETAMIADKAAQLFPLIKQELSGPGGHALPLLTSGKAMAKATVELMDKVAGILEPMRILDSYEQAGAGTRKATLDGMWKDLGDDTAQVMALGARYLAMLWESAWVHGKGSDIPVRNLTDQNPQDVRARYIQTSFVPSLTLDKIGDELT
ncbi:hypothetical protein [Bradyrhizobium tropiciagri]|uniref:Probable serine protease Ga0098714_109514 n=1 Tax=Bradyrhizobium tropiciagri TaxID=312253 RepID=PROT_BRATP|nr:hypothetical protein [Bradyrhizobium tropiciagri]P0DV47.1 RecName: Full=Probable serine protease Ga0098714_109514 [Bradyrhizobium tropiciagri]